MRKWSQMKKRTIAFVLCTALTLSSNAVVFAEGENTVLNNEESSMVNEESSVAVEESSMIIEESSVAVEESSMMMEESSVVIEESSTMIEESSVVIEESSTMIEESSVVINENNNEQKMLGATVSSHISSGAEEVKVCGSKNVDTVTPSQSDESETILSEENSGNEIAEVKEFNYNDDTVVITVVVKDESSLPEGVSLKVTPLNKVEITDDMSASEKQEVQAVNDQYDSTEQLLKDKNENSAGELVKGFLAYDITFVDNNGNKVEPNGVVQVSMQYKAAMLPENVDVKSGSEVTVMHLEEDETGNVVKVVDMEKADLLTNLNVTSEQKIEKVEFETDSFSVYVIVWMAEETVAKTLEVGVVDSDGKEIPGVEDMTLKITADGTEITPKSFPNIFVETEDGSKIEYEADQIQLVDISTGEVTEYKNSSGADWMDLNTDTHAVRVRYKKIVESKTITLTAVLADASKKDLGEIKVTLTREQLEDGTLSVESPVKLISSLVADKQEPSSDKPIPKSYKVNGKEYTFRNAVLIGNDLSSFTKVTYRDAYNKNAKKVTISAKTNTVFVQGLKLNDTKIQYQPNDTQTFDVGTRKIVLVYAEDLNTVPTIDSTSLGVTMRMINFKVRQTDFGGPYGDQVGRTPNLLTKTVKENGYPSTTDGQVDFETWFGENPTGDSNLISSQTVNHLFLESYFKDTGTFHFSGFENYAYLNQETGNFTVYKEIGATDATNKNTYKRGNFFPFNDIAPGVYSPYVNTYDSSGKELPNTDKRKGENLYTGVTDEDYNFGMYIETKFAQPTDGYYRGEPMKFEFNGDDDFWVYIDGVLVLDIGGIHNAQDGYIDFSTGQVYVKPLSKSGAENWEDTTIKAKFIEALGEDGIDEYMFEGDTFADATIHTMQIFYMERGEGASTLHLNFNLPTIPASALQVEKQLGDTEQELYTDENFAFRVYAQPISGYETQLDEYGNEVQVELYDENAAKSEYVVLGEGSGAYIGNSDAKIKFEEDGTFYLKAGETAIFPEIQVNRKYYVEEINLDKIKWDVPKTKYTEDGADTMLPEVSISEDATELETDIRRLSERKKVTFYNYMKEPGNIQIEKKIVNGNQNPDYGFDFKVTVKHAVSGKMVPYAGEYYYLKDKDTGQYIDSNGNLQEPGTTPTAYDRIGNGVIKNVKVGQVVELRGFYEGTEFAVEEVNLKNIYETPVITYDGEEVDSVYKVKGDSTISIVVTNKEKYQYDWTFYKQSKSDSSKLLEGAEFELSSQSKTYYGKSIKDDSTTNVNEAGMIVWYEDGSKVEQIAPGTYQFKETKAPTGYTFSEEVWTVVFADEVSPIVYRDENQNGIPEESELVDNHLVEKVDDSGVRHVITSFYYQNEILYELPATGGSGIHLYTISGVVLMAGAALVLYTNKRKEVL